MLTSSAGVELIKRFEGFSSKPYICPAGVWTIGYGSTRAVTKNTPPISEGQASALLMRELRRYEQSVENLIHVPLTQWQFDALVSFTYNLGGGVLQRSTLRRKVNREQHEDVPHEFLKWVWAGGRRLKGLVARRQAEAEMYSG